MTCRSCGMDIAEKAIVCYRCGAPTADPVSSLPRVSRPSKAILLYVVAAVFLLDMWLIPRTTPGSHERIEMWVATCLAVAGGVGWNWRGRR